MVTWKSGLVMGRVHPPPNLDHKCSKSEGPIVGSMRCAMFRDPPCSSLNNKSRLWIAFQDTRALASCAMPPASGAAQAPDKVLSLRKAGSLSWKAHIPTTFLTPVNKGFSKLSKRGPSI